jgi:hypothetical protein
MSGRPSNQTFRVRIPVLPEPVYSLPLTSPTRRVCRALTLHFPPYCSVCWPTDRVLADFASVSRWTVGRELRRLEVLGAIKRLTCGEFARWHYRAAVPWPADLKCHSTRQRMIVLCWRVPNLGQPGTEFPRRGLLPTGLNRCCQRVMDILFRRHEPAGGVH